MDTATAIKRMDAKLTFLLNKPAQGPKWLRPKEVSLLTIWKENKDLRRARRNDYVKVKKEGKSILYDLTSIDVRFLIHNEKP